MAREVSRHIPLQKLLWGRAGGRCELCNSMLYEHDLTKKTVNIAQNAHIWAFGDGWTRSNAAVSDDDINSIDNLILLCYPCHRVVDGDATEEQFTAAYLQHAKQSHEERIERVTGIDPDNRSFVVTYGSNVGDVPAPPCYAAACRALFASGRFPANSSPGIALGMTGSWAKDHDAHFWEAEEQQLRAGFADHLAPFLRRQEVAHLSLFAIAPQPLLVLLGTLLTDIPAVDVYQLHREPKTWEWLQDDRLPSLRVERPDQIVGPPALVLSISGTVTDDRIHSALSRDVTIWRVSVPQAGNDILRSPAQLREFRELIRPLFDQIKTAHGQGTLLHVFPAMPIATAVEFGRARQPKADLPWRVYDQVNKREGFIPAIDIQ